MRHRRPLFVCFPGALPLLGGCCSPWSSAVPRSAPAPRTIAAASAPTSTTSASISARYDSVNKDKELALKNNVIIVVYDGVILLVGEVRTAELKQRAERLVSGFEGTRKVVNELEVREPEGFWSRRADNATDAHASRPRCSISPACPASIRRASM